MFSHVLPPSLVNMLNSEISKKVCSSFSIPNVSPFIHIEPHTNFSIVTTREKMFQTILCLLHENDITFTFNINEENYILNPNIFTSSQNLDYNDVYFNCIFYHKYLKIGFFIRIFSQDENSFIIEFQRKFGDRLCFSNLYYDFKSLFTLNCKDESTVYNPNSFLISFDKNESFSLNSNNKKSSFSLFEFSQPKNESNQDNTFFPPNFNLIISFLNSAVYDEVYTALNTICSDIYSSNLEKKNQLKQDLMNDRSIQSLCNCLKQHPDTFRLALFILLFLVEEKESSEQSSLYNIIHEHLVLYISNINLNEVKDKFVYNTLNKLLPLIKEKFPEQVYAF